MPAMNRRGFLKAMGVGVAAISAGRVSAWAAQAVDAARENRPNIILCMADDQGWGDVGYNDKAKSLRKNITTPVLDAMAGSGLRLDRFYAAQAVCSPTRGSVMTGRHPNRYGCYIYGKPLRPQEMTVAQALKTVGYTTGHFGKWHLNGVSGAGKLIPASDPLNPGRFGFDEWFSTSNFFDLDWSFSHNGQTVKTTGDGSDVIMAEALKFIAKANSQGKPFLAVVWFGSPHSPIKALPEYKAKAGGDAYCGEIYGIDHSMGMLRVDLRKLGIAENTLVWYCSDNGATGSGSNGGLRGGKGTIFEGGVRVPCIIEWPARIKKPSSTDVPAVTSDIYPTILDIVGYQAPNQVKPIDGISILPLIEGKMTSRPRPIGFVWSGNGKTKGHAAWSDNRYKLLKHTPDKYELYDLVDDMSESKDIAAEKPDIVARMKAELELWLDSVEDSDKGKDYQDGSRRSPA